MHDGAHIKEHVVEGTDGQASSFVSIFQGDDGSVQGVGEVSEPRAAGLNDLYGALQIPEAGQDEDEAFRQDG